MKFCDRCEEWVEPEEDEKGSLHCPDCNKRLGRVRKNKDDDEEDEVEFEEVGDDDFI